MSETPHNHQGYFTVTLEVGVVGANKLTAAQVHEALCRYLHEECINFVHDDCTIEFTNVEEVIPTEGD